MTDALQDKTAATSLSDTAENTLGVTVLPGSEAWAVQAEGCCIRTSLDGVRTPGAGITSASSGVMWKSLCTDPRGESVWLVQEQCWSKHYSLHNEFVGNVHSCSWYENYDNYFIM